MATKRYILYISDISETKILEKWIRAQTHIQLLQELSEIPDWLQELPLPVLVDQTKKEAYFGPKTLQNFFDQKKPNTKFAPVDFLD